MHAYVSKRSNAVVTAPPAAPLPARVQPIETRPETGAGPARAAVRPGPAVSAFTPDASDAGAFPTHVKRPVVALEAAAVAPQDEGAVPAPNGLQRNGRTAPPQAPPAHDPIRTVLAATSSPAPFTTATPPRPQAPAATPSPAPFTTLAPPRPQAAAAIPSPAPFTTAAPSQPQAAAAIPSPAPFTMAAQPQPQAAAATPSPMPFTTTPPPRPQAASSAPTRVLARSATAAPPPAFTPAPVQLARAPAAQHPASGGGGGASGSGSGDAVYDELLRRLRDESEQLGRLIQHPF